MLSNFSSSLNNPPESGKRMCNMNMFADRDLVKKNLLAEEQQVADQYLTTRDLSNS